jgi:hypothetical protein
LSYGVAISAIFAALRSRSFRDFTVAITVSLLANMGFLYATGREVFIHYVPLLPFVYLLYANFFSLAQASKLKQALAIAVAAIFIGGGVESAWTLSKRVDAKNGLSVQRQVIERIMADLNGEGSLDTPVSLKFDFFSTLYPYRVLSTEEYGHEIKFSKRAELARLRYLLSDGKSSPPEGATAYSVDDLTLYRLP